MFGHAHPTADRQVFGRVFGDIVDRTGIGIAPVKRRLRAFDDFHPLDRRRVEPLDVPLIIYAVDKERGTGFDACLHARQHVGCAADDGAVGGAAKRLAKTDSGSLLGKIVERIQPLLGNRIRGDDRDGDRRVRQRFFGLAGGDQNFGNAAIFDLVGGSLPILRYRRLRYCQCSKHKYACRTPNISARIFHHCLPQNSQPQPAT